MLLTFIFCFFFFNDTATTEIYTLSLHDALPISRGCTGHRLFDRVAHRHSEHARANSRAGAGDRKSTRLNSSHLVISYAVFCLKKKKKQHLVPDTLLYRLHNKTSARTVQQRATQ